MLIVRPMSRRRISVTFYDPMVYRMVALEDKGGGKVGWVETLHNQPEPVIKLDSVDPRNIKDAVIYALERLMLGTVETQAEEPTT